MIDLEFTFSGRLWKWKAGSWHFITLPENLSQDIKTFTRHNYKGFGSVRVKVTIGKTEWLTSLFPDKKSGCYFLPVKAPVRKAEGLEAETNVHVNIRVQV